MKKIYLLLFFILPFLLCAQTSGDIAKSFGSYPGFSDFVTTIATQADGKILMGGSFTAYKGGAENRIIRLNADGTKDTTFNSGIGFDNLVTTIKIQVDGKILVGGYFTTYNGNTENHIIRLNADGTEDTTFNTGTGFNDAVTAITIQTDGKILVGGNFSTYKEGTENYIIRLNADGTKDTTFNTGTGFDNYNDFWLTHYSIDTIVIQTDGKILVGGNFFSYNGSTGLNSIIRLNVNGTRDTTFNIGTGFQIFDAMRDGIVSGTVSAIVLQTDGKILVGGNFTTYKGSDENYIIRLNTNGTKDTTFNTGSGFDLSVLSIVLQTDGKILVGGSFTAYKGSTENRIIRLNTDGTKDTAFNTGVGFNSSVNTIARQTDGKILVGGYFTTYKGSLKNYVIRLDANGTEDTTFNTGSGFNDAVTAIATQTDGKILVGGNFNTFKNGTENRIIRLNADGTKDTAFNTGVGFNSYFSVSTIATQTDGKILVGGSFTTYNGSTENGIIRLNTDGTKDTAFNAGAGFNGSVNTISIQTDGKILVGGYFTTYKGITKNRIIRLNTDGSEDTTFNTGAGFNVGVSTIAIQTDGKIVVGGSFTTYNGSAEKYIIRLNTDGTKDTTFTTGSGLNVSVNIIAPQADGKILVGGNFTTYNGSAENYIIRLNADGTKDTAFISGTGFNGAVNTITTQADGKILLGGNFTTYNGSTENRIIRLNTNGSEDTTFIVGTGFNSSVNAIITQTNGKILVGGRFTTYKDDNSSAGVISLHLGANASLKTPSFTDSNSFTVYPNPSEGIFNLDIENSAAIHVFDINGKQILSRKIAVGTSQIDLSGYNSGIYILKSTDVNNKSETTKLVKK